MKDEGLVVICDCHSLNHIIRFSSYKEENEFYIVPILNKNHSFFRRIKVGLNYIFGGLINLNPQNYDYADVCLTKEKCKELKELLEYHLNEDVEKENPTKYLKRSLKIEEITKCMESFCLNSDLILKINYAVKIKKRNDIYELAVVWYDAYKADDTEYLETYKKELEEKTKEYSVAYVGKHGVVLENLELIKIEV